ncbi:hypothetical protein SAMN04515617_1246 [Collimonas sp. OK242]|jgi:hypothetical protein|nr:hypothetical protein SAMN04515617_1246 [Collimonas sp. OK242]
MYVHLLIIVPFLGYTSHVAAPFRSSIYSTICGKTFGEIN